jgi:hypothetical protein
MGEPNGKETKGDRSDELEDGDDGGSSGHGGGARERDGDVIA